MNEVKGTIKENYILLNFSGHIDSGNAPEAEKEALAFVTGKEGQPIVIDASELTYISSAGLRVILHLRKIHPELKIINVSPEVYEILDMTGFTQMMTIEKKFRTVSVEGCEEIGRGANGTIYRIDQDNVVKVYNNADALEEIQHEREVARTALVLGIPTAISYEVVRVGESYGSVFELLNARSFSKILAEDPEKMDWCVKEYVDLLKKIHSTIVPKGKLPDIRETGISWAKFLQDYLPKESGDKLLALVEEIPHDDHMIHGDYHTKNVELVGDEVLLIDMDTLAVGHPIFELASMYNAYIGYGEYDHSIIKSFLGFDFETAKNFWRKVLSAYLGTEEKEKILQVENKARILGYTRMIRRLIRRKGLETEQGKAEIELWTKELLALLESTDTLLFSHNELNLEALKENLPKVLEFVDAQLPGTNCSAKAQMEIEIAVEEIFVNIAEYAYRPEKGSATIRVEVSDAPLTVTITFIDHGTPYDPLAKTDPDVTLTAEEREIGGLGIFMAKNVMDEITYEYKNGQNILRLKKDLKS